MRKKFGQRLSIGDLVNASSPLDDLETDVYGSFANAIEARLRHLEADRTHK
jgi:hypothetical protein